MSRKPEVKTYEIDLGGNTKEIIEEPQITANPTVSNQEPSIETTNTVKPEEHGHIINTNPFTFKCDKKQYYGVYSIEDFNIQVKRKLVLPMKQILRTDNYSKGKKKRLIIGAIKQWEKDFKENKNQAVIRNTDTVGNIAKVEIKKIGAISYILLPLILALLLLITFKIGSFWHSEANGFLIKLGNAREKMFYYQWIQYVTTIGIYVSIAGLFYIGIYNSICHDYFGVSKQHDQLSNRLKNQVDNDFKSKSKKTMKYYKKALTKEVCTCDPLPIEQTGITDVDFSSLDELTNAYTHKVNSIKKKKGLLCFIKFILFKGSYVTAIAVYGCLGYEIVAQLISGGK